jgi:hypothetical protein
LPIEHFEENIFLFVKNPSNKYAKKGTPFLWPPRYICEESGWTMSRVYGANTLRLIFFKPQLAQGHSVCICDFLESSCAAKNSIKLSQG